MDNNGGFTKEKSSLRTERKVRRTSRRINTTVLRKVKKLQKLIPGGKGLNADRLFDHTASYIMHLKLQVDVLQALSDVYRP
ncbi:hypothetical protein CTI12_AA242120 [Artemisia annua]|uniref:Myc-type, basic helix-loop-helix (BHLH) domain-containing protein n=1 Tax=Artemisia annua TaxID=35608 RepID=A0A2U1NP99_ARTAN|nr:hypothetical protein CTI12_AA242120 [Artemisia annua]